MVVDLHFGDCLEVMATLPDASIDCVLTDPPYGLGFMGKQWDTFDRSQFGRAGNEGENDLKVKKNFKILPRYKADNSFYEFSFAWATEVYRVLKPGAYLLAFGGSRTYHRMACAIEDAGFEIRDQIQWIYGSGFPKSLDVSKQIDKMHGAEREVVGITTSGKILRSNGDNERPYQQGKTRLEQNVTVASSDEAKQWDGWGTALKPAHEPIVMARKPLEKGLTVAQNVLKWGTGAINVDGCRVEVNNDEPNVRNTANHLQNNTSWINGNADKKSVEFATSGRFPANVIHDGSDEVLAGFPQTTSGAHRKGEKNGSHAAFGKDLSRINEYDIESDTGSASRFFYCAKASKNDRDAGLDGMPLQEKNTRNSYGDQSEYECPDGANRVGNKGASLARNHHPTVKPTELMRYLCRLVTPPKGVILDPFMGSGSTGKAALLEGLNFIGIENNLEYFEIAKNRIEGVKKKEPLFMEMAA